MGLGYGSGTDILLGPSGDDSGVGEEETIGLGVEL